MSKFISGNYVICVIQNRYKIEMYVINGESKYRFVFWEYDCADIIGKTADNKHKTVLEVQIFYISYTL